MTNVFGNTVDSGAFPQTFDRALAADSWTNILVSCLTFICVSAAELGLRYLQVLCMFTLVLPQRV